MSPKPWVVYVRVSTDEQANSGASLDAQEQACRGLLTAHGYDTIEVVRDPGASAKNLARPGMGTLLRRIEASEIAGVCVSAIDRLTRRNRDLLDLVDLFESKRVELISVRERVDTSGPMGRFVLNLIGGIAQLERELIASRVKQGMAHRKAQGGFLARAPAGTIAVRGTDKLRRLQPHPEHAKVVERVWSMVAEGRTLMHVCEYLNGHGISTTLGKRWSKTAASELIASPNVVGVIVDRETWERAQEALTSRRRRARALDERPAPNPRSEQTWPLAGLCYCAGCGSAMTIGTGTGRGGRVYTYLRCSGRLKRGRTFCDAPDLPYAAMEPAIVEGLGRRVRDGGVTKACAKWLAERRARVADQVGKTAELRAERDKLQRRLELVWEVVEAGGDTGRAARDRLGEVRRAIDAVDGELTGIEAAEAILARDEEALAALGTKVQTGLERLPSATEEQRRGVLAGLIERIDLSRERVSLELAVPGLDGSLDCAEWRTQQDSNLRPSA